MHYQESETVELKAIVIDDIKKEIIAFANCEGGRIYIGVEDDGDSFEMMRSLKQELTFNALEHEFNQRNVDLGISQMHTLKLIDKDGLYSNLALLLSEQCLQSTKVAVFQGNDQTVFKDRREFTGSLMQQMNEVYDFIDFRNQTKATIERLLRVDVRDYPEVAVREALLNMLVHRDYSIRASGLISIYADRIEFVSVGGLLPGIELDDVMAGLSVCRNQELANVFYRLHLIEAYGTGLGKIMKVYAGARVKPTISTTRNTFKLVLPNINAESNNTANSELKFGFKEDASANVAYNTYNDDLNDRETIVLNFLKGHNIITRPQTEKLLGVSSATASRLLRSMVDGGKLIQKGRGRDTVYTVR